MILTFKHKGLLLLWKTGDTRKLPHDQITKITHILTTLNVVKQVPNDLISFKNWGIHKLRGNYDSYWSLIIKENWRIVFRFDEENVYDVDLVDYH